MPAARALKKPLFRAIDKKSTTSLPFFTEGQEVKVQMMYADLKRRSSR